MWGGECGECVRVRESVSCVCVCVLVRWTGGWMAGWLGCVAMAPLADLLRDALEADLSQHVATDALLQAAR